MIIAYYYTYILREQNLLPMKFEYMLLILFTLKFLGVRYISITLYKDVAAFLYSDIPRSE